MTTDIRLEEQTDIIVSIEHLVNQYSIVSESHLSGGKGVVPGFGLA